MANNAQNLLFLKLKPSVSKDVINHSGNVLLRKLNKKKKFVSC